MMPNNNLKEQLKGIYVITDPALMTDNLITMVEQAIQGGINILQYRNKLASIEQQEKEASLLTTLCNKHNVTFIVNDNVELALKVNADGVHLGQSDTDISNARQQLGDDKIIGITCNNELMHAIKAQSQGADYVAFGRFFNSLTKPTAPQAPISLLSEAKNTINIPIVAIGGITPDTANILLAQGVSMLAIIQGIFGQAEVQAASREFVDIFNAHNAAD